MAAFLFVAAILLAGTVLLGRRWARLSRQRAGAKLLGRSPSRPLTIQRFDKIDDYIANTRCLCGGPVNRLGEGSRNTPSGMVRVVHCECTLCEEETDLFFVQKRVLH